MLVAEWHTTPPRGRPKPLDNKKQFKRLKDVQSLADENPGINFYVNWKKGAKRSYIVRAGEKAYATKF